MQKESSIVNIRERNKYISIDEYFNLIAHLPIAIYACDADGYLRHFNQAAITLWGRKPETGIDQWCGSFKAFTLNGDLLPADQGPLAKSYQAFDNIPGIEIIIERANGSRRHVISYPKLIIGNGSVQGSINILMDVTDKRHIDETFLQIENHFQQVLQTLPYAAYTCDTQGNIISYNETALALWGRTPQPHKDKYCGAFRIFDWNGDTVNSFNSPMAITLQSGIPQNGKQLIIERPNGDRIHVLAHASPIRTKNGKMTGAINMLVDVTELSNAREKISDHQEIIHKTEALRLSEERYQLMIEEVSDYAIVMLDLEGNIQNWNKGAQAIKGYTSQEAIGKNFRIFYTEEDIQTQLPERLLSQATLNGRATHEGWRLRKDGSHFWGSIVITALHGKDNSVIGFSKVTRDLSERKASEEALREKAIQLEEKNIALESMNQELASFAYVSSHDLQEPLRKIQTFASRIMEADYQNLSERSKDFFNRMQNAALRMQNLIDDLLTYSRTNNTSTGFENMNLNEVVQEVIHDLKDSIEEKDAVVHVGHLPTIPVISFQFAQLVTNILSNSLKFSRSEVKPVINITYSVVASNTITERHITGTTSYHCISFEDNGIGFDPEHRHRIFEVFQRLHGKMEYNGSGIGLSICKKIAENHKGFIVADGRPGDGSTFRFYIPA